MKRPMPSTPPWDCQPLVSTRLMRAIALFIVGAALLPVALGLGGRWAGAHLVPGDYSREAAPVRLRVNGHVLELPANAIRFTDQRQGGNQPRADLHLLWPDLDGYTDAGRRIFNGASEPHRLIFVSLLERTMPLDMSARLGPVYSKMASAPPRSAGHGLVAHALGDDARYRGETLYVGERPGQSGFAARCLDERQLPPGARACLRDVHIGAGLTMTYRFSSRLLGEWRELDAAMAAYVAGALQAGRRPRSAAP